MIYDDEAAEEKPPTLAQKKAPSGYSKPAKPKTSMLDMSKLTAAQSN